MATNFLDKICKIYLYSSHSHSEMDWNSTALMGALAVEMIHFHCWKMVSVGLTKLLICYHLSRGFLLVKWLHRLRLWLLLAT